MGMNQPDKEREGMEVLNGVPREQANVEVEKGEVVLSSDGTTNHKITASVGGEKHSNGGTPENLPEGTAVYSDTLKLKDPTLLKVLGFSGNKPKTFAQIAKKWDTAKLIKKKEDPTNDKIATTGLDRSLENANFKLSLAFALQQFHEKKNGSQEEHSKHFEPLLERTGLSYEHLLDTGEESNLADSPEQSVMFHGGEHTSEKKKARIKRKMEKKYGAPLVNQSGLEGYDHSMTGDLRPRMQVDNEGFYKIPMGDHYLGAGLFTPDVDRAAYPNDNIHLAIPGGPQDQMMKIAQQFPLDHMDMGGQIGFNPLPEYHDGGEPGHTHEGDPPPSLYTEEESQLTPTGKRNYFKARNESYEDYAQKWSSVAGIDLNSYGNKGAQEKAYEWALKNNPDAIRNMWRTYGLTAKGLNNPELAKLAKNGEFSYEDLEDPAVLKKLKDAYVDGFYGVRQLDPNAPKLDKTTVVEKITPDPRVLDPMHKWNVQNMPEGEDAPEDMRFRWENRRALAQARKNRATIPYLRPLTAVPDTFYADQAYYNPDQAIAAIQSASATQGLQRGMFAGPQQQLANQLAGNQFQMLANVTGQYADKNVNAYNRERMMNTQIANRASENLARAVQGHHDKVTTLKQGFANAFKAADNQVAEQEIAMHQERAQRRNLEMSIGEQYRIDPNTGLRVFVKGKDFFPDTSADTTVDDRFAEIMRKHPGMSEDAAVKLAMAEFSGKYNIQSSDAPYDERNYRS